MTAGGSVTPNASSSATSTSIALSDVPPRLPNGSCAPIDSAGRSSTRAHAPRTASTVSARPRGAAARLTSGARPPSARPHTASGEPPSPPVVPASPLSPPLAPTTPSASPSPAARPRAPRSYAANSPASKRSRSRRRCSFPLVVRGKDAGGRASTRTSSWSNASRTRAATRSSTSAAPCAGRAQGTNTTTRSAPLTGSVEPTTAGAPDGSPGVAAATSSMSGAWKVRPLRNSTSLCRPVTHSRPSLRNPRSPVRSQPPANTSALTSGSPW